MTQLLRRKALTASAPDPLRRKAIGFLALAKTAHQQAAVAGAKPPSTPASPPLV